MKKMKNRVNQKRKRLEKTIKETSPSGWESRGKSEEFKAYLSDSIKKYLRVRE